SGERRGLVVGDHARTCQPGLHVERRAHQSMIGEEPVHPGFRGRAAGGAAQGGGALVDHVERQHVELVQRARELCSEGLEYTARGRSLPRGARASKLGECLIFVCEAGEVGRGGGHGRGSQGASFTTNTSSSPALVMAPSPKSTSPWR